MNKHVAKVLETTDLFSEADVKCSLAAIAMFGEVDLLYSIIGQRTVKFLDLFCDYDSDEDFYSIKSKFVPINGMDLWTELLIQLKNNHGFTEAGMPPRTFDFNIYQKEKFTHQTLSKLVYLQQHKIPKIAAAVARYYETTPYATTLGKLIEGPLASLLVFDAPEEREIEGLM